MRCVYFAADTSVKKIKYQRRIIYKRDNGNLTTMFKILLSFIQTALVSFHSRYFYSFRVERRLYVTNRVRASLDFLTSNFVS